MKMCNFQNDNVQLKAEIDTFKGQLSSVNEKHLHQDSECQDKLHRQESEITDLRTELGKNQKPNTLIFRK